MLLSFHFIAGVNNLPLLNQLSQEKNDFFPLNRALSLSAMDEDSTESKVDELLRQIHHLVEKQREEVSYSYKKKIAKKCQSFFLISDHFKANILLSYHYTFAGLKEEARGREAETTEMEGGTSHCSPANSCFNGPP